MKIDLKAKVLKDKIVCYDIRSLQAIVGSTAVVGNYALYGVTKTDFGFEISKSSLKERLSILKSRRDNLNETIRIMEQALK